jgi:hypothetical protein
MKPFFANLRSADPLFSFRPERCIELFGRKHGFMYSFFPFIAC